MKVTVCEHELTISGHKPMRCALGPNGIHLNKSEGDGRTPSGTFPLRRVLYRQDRLPAPETRLPVCAITHEDGWCDDPAHPKYNQAIKFPFRASAEKMWRDDGAYDICVILGYNDDPPLPGKGSAIFFHLAKQGYPPTEGCVAVSLEDMRQVLAVCGPESVMEIATHC